MIVSRGQSNDTHRDNYSRKPAVTQNEQRRCTNGNSCHATDEQISRAMMIYSSANISCSTTTQSSSPVHDVRLDSA